MTLQTPVVFGNWKMHGLQNDAVRLAKEVGDRVAGLAGTFGIFPPLTALSQVASIAGGRLIVGAQDCHEAERGAFTGSVSAAMVRDAGGAAVILGHSERRHGLAETSELVARKVAAAQAAGLLVVLCIGETEEEWQAGRRQAVLRGQLRDSMPHAVDRAMLVIAYEPVWAIGTGRTPSLDDIDGTHAFIRDWLATECGPEPTTPLLYGGSVKAENAADILALETVDGALVGGASLDAESFGAICAAGRA